LYLSAQTGGAKIGSEADSAENSDGAAMARHAIRGGIPISFPQFSVRGPLPKHGFIRLQKWTYDLEQNIADKGGAPVDPESGQAELTLQVSDDAQSRAIWAQAFHAELKVELERNCLRTTLSITNRSAQAWEFTTALHSYLRVDDILQTALAGLQHTRYQDATANNTEVVDQGERLTIAGEVDRVYMSPPATLHLLENNVPTLRIQHEGFSDTVVWNPGPELVRSLADFPDDDWRRMLCVEAACAARPVLLQPGQTWRGTQMLTALTDGVMPAE
jgi:glucose-6-phosphate 1-epimerase